jgi:hypothetical protein
MSVASCGGIEHSAAKARDFQRVGQMHTLRQRVQANLNDTAPSDLMEGTTFEADEIYQNALE